MVENEKILESLLFDHHHKQKQTKPNHQIKHQWSMVMIRDSVSHGDLSIFPPINHENLHRQIQQHQQKQNPPSKSTLSPPTNAVDVIQSSGGCGIGEWLGIGVDILRAKLVSLACYLGYGNGTTIRRAFWSFRRVIDLAAVVLLWWLCKRLMRRSCRKENAERLRMIIKEKDEVSADQKGRLLISTEILNQSTDRVKERRKTMLETEELGVSILQDLHHQRQSLLHAHTTLHGVDDNISRSKKVLTTIPRRMNRNKLIICSIVGALVLDILLVLHFKLTH